MSPARAKTYGEIARYLVRLGRHDLLVLALVVGCGGAIAPTARPSVQAPSPAPDDALHVVVERDRVKLGELTASPLSVDNRMQRVDALYDYMRTRPKDKPYRLSVKPGARGVDVLSVTYTAGFAGHEDFVFFSRERTARMHVFVGRPVPPAGAWTKQWPAEALMVSVHRDTIELSRIPNRHKTSQGAARPIRSLTHAQIHADLADVLAQECTAALPCSPLALSVDAEVEFAGADIAIAAVEAAERKRGAAGPDVLLSAGKMTVVGPPHMAFLPRDVVEPVVRANRSALRACYEQGLRRDPTLRGRIALLFIVRKDGKVESASAADQSDLPDKEVVDCVVKACKGFEFPAASLPEADVVIAPYPLVLSPDEK